jgi:serine/threonine protein kinase
LIPPHPNIVDFYGAADLQSTRRGVSEFFMLMEFVSGGVLSDVMYEGEWASRGISEAKVWKIFLECCLAVEHLHHLNPSIIHRDIKVCSMLVEMCTVSQRE